MHIRLFVFQWWFRAPGLAIRRRKVNKLEQLENPDSTESLKAVRNRVAKHYPSKTQRHYVSNKLRSDPVYEAVFKLLEKHCQLPLLDVGCGIGLLEFYLREREIHTPILAIDHDIKKIKTSNLIADSHYQDLRFIAGYIDSELPAQPGNVTLLDILQYNNERDQEDILRKASEAVAPGGLLIIRSGLNDSSKRSKISKIADRFGTFISWIKSSVHEFPTESFVSDILQSEGLQGESKPLWGNTPFNNYLLTYRRPHTNESAAGKTQR
ncbi:MAG: class I SAM-dependent methyltransferase [Verrucomicrobiota bacterium]